MDPTQQAQPPAQLKTLLLALLPGDHTTVGNTTLLAQLQASARDAGLEAISEGEFKAARDVLVADGQAIKGKGRGGSLARATDAVRPDFALKPEEVTPDMLLAAAASKAAKASKPKAAPQAASVGDPQVLAYRHADRRKNNPRSRPCQRSQRPRASKNSLGL